MKTILTVADGGPALEAALSLGVACAGLFDSVHDVLHVRDSDSLRLPAAEMELDGSAIRDLARGQQRVVMRAAAACSAYARLAGHTTGASLVEMQGNEAACVVQLGRVSDLIVVGRPGADPDKPEPAYVSAAIFEAARPVLIAPPGAPRWPLRKVVVAWNGTAQAARALGYAVPFLRRAASVSVLSIGPPETRAPVKGPARFLDRHGIAAKSEGLDLGTVSARARGRGLVNFVDTAGADLLVMGAYGHNAVMKFLGLGGATGKVITASKVPVLLAH